ncbi:MAG: hypothetical protein IKU35_02870 [Bacteroidaceae bacterium]|nr:hypothetical protein [Bacteroidaceae bacterium]MBR5276065.1 hypothetical protein [Bacteroidaceae bacterium]MBR5890548.1 hypothetical protein [Bacteroidaceae bacterium]
MAEHRQQGRIYKVKSVRMVRITVFTNLSPRLCDAEYRFCREIFREHPCLHRNKRATPLFPEF